VENKNEESKKGEDEYYRPMTEEEKKRQATYSYFNKKYRKTAEQ